MKLKTLPSVLPPPQDQQQQSQEQVPFLPSNLTVAVQENPQPGSQQVCLAVITARGAMRLKRAPLTRIHAPRGIATVQVQ